jgi:hypothetical protein
VQRIALEIYSHVAPHMQEAAAAKIDAVLREALAQPKPTS